MKQPTYNVITFAPVQGFIEKSRKLRDLYGSSYLLSLLSWVICQAAERQGCQIVSPASINIVQGMPNQIILKGSLSEEGAIAIKKTFFRSWKAIVDTCRQWIELHLNQWQYAWKRDWDLWGTHAWEFFWALGKPGDTITEVRGLINQAKNSRDWTGINWQGESSTLSGTDAIAYHNLGKTGNPDRLNHQQEREEITTFYSQLSLKLGEYFISKSTAEKAEKEKLAKKYGSSFIDIREQLSIPELVKRIITHRAIIGKFKDKFQTLGLDLDREKIDEIAKELNPGSFRELNRHKEKVGEEKYWTGWFQGDGDGAGKYFKSLKVEEEERATREFSAEMREWGKQFKESDSKLLDNKGKTIYAGGDDFLGVLYYPEKPIQPQECLELLSSFKSQIWHGDKPKKITSSVGFVWAGPQVPQRDILQNCHQAEQSAKKKGRDRLALRILFNSGNHLEWVCPWWVLDEAEIEKLSPRFPTPKKTLIESYKSRSQDQNWTHFYRDIAFLESRHAFDGERITVEGKQVNDPEISVALGLIEIYFGSEWFEIISDEKNWFNCYDENDIQTFTGILGDPKSFDQHSQVKQALNDWVINLAKIGFRLTANN